MEETFVDALGEIVHFSSKKQMREFVKSELYFWMKILGAGDAKNTDRLNQYHSGRFLIAANALEIFENIKKALGSDPSKDSDPDVLYDVYDLKEELREKWIYSESSAAKRCLEISQTSRADANSFYRTITSRDQPNKISTGEYLALEFLTERHTLRPRLELELETCEKSLAKLQASINATELLKERMFSGTQLHAKHLGEITKNQCEEYRERATALEDLYEEKLRLKGPAKYWSEKAKRHRKRGMKAIVALISLLCGSAASLYYLFLTWLSDSSTPISVDNFEGLLLFIALISTLAFLSRILSRITFSEFHLQRDAEERLQLTHLYLSLSDETSLQDDARIVVLQSLFSRAETGLLANESGPTMPGIADLLNAIKRN